VGRFVADLGARVTGVDLSPRSATLAQRLNAGLRVVTADMRALPIAAGSCAGVVAFYSLTYTANPSATLFELRRVRDPGARS
jgi:ubiquinone/menaquinone biosynthesis C-methylase UbiE